MHRDSRLTNNIVTFPWIKIKPWKNDNITCTVDLKHRGEKNNITTSLHFFFLYVKLISFLFSLSSMRKKERSISGTVIIRLLTPCSLKLCCSGYRPCFAGLERRLTHARGLFLRMASSAIKLDHFWDRPHNIIMAILTNPAKEKSKPLALQNAPSNFHVPDLFRTS